MSAGTAALSQHLYLNSCECYSWFYCMFMEDKILGLIKSYFYDLWINGVTHAPQKLIFNIIEYQI